MNCNNCQDLLSEYVDGLLSPNAHAEISLHLEECQACAGVHDDLASILSFCVEHRGEYDSPPNPNALWLRISNVIEGEQDFSRNRKSAQPEKREGWWAGFSGRTLELSLSQIAMIVTAIIVVVSVSTMAGLRQLRDSSDSGSRVAINSQNSSAPIAAVSDMADNRLLQEQQAINYWTQRVELNKSRWSPQMREAFERNVGVIDQTVKDSMLELKRNPHDEVSEEMLYAALSDKMKLLKEFSEP